VGESGVPPLKEPELVPVSAPPLDKPEPLELPEGDGTLGGSGGTTMGTGLMVAMVVASEML
jgi:hypothetical protein